MYISMGAMINLPVPEIIDMNKNPNIYSIVIAILSFVFLIYGFDIIKNGIKKFFINYGVLNLIYHNILVKILRVKWV